MIHNPAFVVSVVTEFETYDATCWFVGFANVCCEHDFAIRKSLVVQCECAELARVVFLVHFNSSFWFVFGALQLSRA